MSARSGLLPLIPTLLGGWIALAQVLSFAGLAIWVVTGSVLTGWLVLGLLNHARPGLALVLAMVLTLAFAAMAEKFGGSSSGPVTRATLMSVGVTVAMAFISRTRYRAWSLVPSLTLFAGALGLGAAGIAPWIAVAWVALSLISLLALGPYAGTDLAAPPRRISVISVVGAAGLVAALLMVLLGSVMTSPWTIDGLGAGGPVLVVDGSIPPVTTPPGESTTSSVVPPETPSSISEQPSFLSWWVIVGFWCLAIGLLLVAFLLLERIWVWLRWRALRHRLRRQDPRDSLVGSWTWLRLRLAHAGHALAAHESPDVSAAMASADGDGDLAWLAESVSLATYDRTYTVSRADGRRAWRIFRQRTPGAFTGGVIAAYRRSGWSP